jgi:hypothetical protein
MISIHSSGGRIYKFGLGLRVRRGLFRLGRWLLKLSRLQLDNAEMAPQPYQLDPASQFAAATRDRLQRATEDFEAARAGLYPIHAKEGAAFLDGGTSTWEGEGYTLTLLKSLTTVGEVPGYMYGPVLQLDYPLAHGNTTQISHVRFYSGAELERVLRKNK